MSDPINKSVDATPETTDAWPMSKILKCVIMPKPRGAPKAGNKEIAMRVGLGVLFLILLGTML